MPWPMGQFILARPTSVLKATGPIVLTASSRNHLLAHSNLPTRPAPVPATATKLVPAVLNSFLPAFACGHESLLFAQIVAVSVILRHTFSFISCRCYRTVRLHCYVTMREEIWMLGTISISVWLQFFDLLSGLNGFQRIWSRSNGS